MVIARLFDINESFAYKIEYGQYWAVVPVSSAIPWGSLGLGKPSIGEYE